MLEAPHEVVNATFLEWAAMRTLTARRQVQFIWKLKPSTKILARNCQDNVQQKFFLYFVLGDKVTPCSEC